MNLKALLGMVRPGNSVMAGMGIAIGFLFSGESELSALLLLIIAGSSALGFGNVVNDIYDIETDKVAHPGRALPSGKVSIGAAIGFAVLLVIISLAAGFAVSSVHGWATLIPLIILWLYAVWLKGTPLTGNLIVSALVSYTLIYGAIGGSPLSLTAPAVLAFVTNLIREIVKDLADEEGDRSAGITTTAFLNRSFVNVLVYGLIVLSISAAPFPAIMPLFRLIYLPGVILILLPLQIIGFRLYRAQKMVVYSKNLKYQLLTGLLLVAAEGVRILI